MLKYNFNISNKECLKNFYQKEGKGEKFDE